jgi:predicted TPR repeat methyltransferase
VWCASTMANARLQPDRDPVSEARALIAEGRPGDAAGLLEMLIGEGRAGLLARVTYTQALQALGETVAVLEHARETAVLFPGIAVAALALGEALLGAGHLPTAIAELQRALRIDPDLAEARYQLAVAWLEAGEPEKALQEFASVPPERAPADLQEKIVQAEHMRALARSNPNYVRHLFDQFSADYDARMLGQLGYAAPQILRELAALVLPESGERSLDILDLGCGTGLSGLAFRAMAKRLDGIDLSPAMMKQARDRGIYDDLRAGDVESPCGEDAYDLVIAADTLVYLGDLSRVLESVHCALRAGGHFLFTVEKEDGAGYSLGPKRRWRHSESWLRVEAERAGFDVTGAVACSPRTEAGLPVEGMAMALRKRD